MHRHRPRSTVILAITLLSILGGCISSESSRYERKLGLVVAPDSAANPAVAIAFKLDKHGQTTVMSVVRDEDEDK
jgi:hypothetical protein